MSFRPNSYTILTLCVLLAGCSLAISADDIKTATELCREHGGVKWIWTTSDSARCNDGLDVNYKSMRKEQR